mgnify:CR=1 FL=1
MKKNHLNKKLCYGNRCFYFGGCSRDSYFFECVQRSVQVNSQNTVRINVQRQSEHLRTILDINYQYLNEISSAMGRSEELFQKKIKNDWYPFMKKQTWRGLLLLIRMEMHTTTME